MKIMVFLDSDSGVQAEPFADEFWVHNNAWIDEWLFKEERLEVEVYYSPGDASMMRPKPKEWVEDGA